MGSASFHRAPVRTAPRRDASAGPRGVAVAPPRYGIDFVDRKVVQRVPIGTYQSSTPAKDGTRWDTDATATHNGATVPSHIIAVMRNPGYGGVPSVEPPGWNYLRGKFGRLKGQWVRFHIINAALGGPGNDAGNLVPTTHAVNHNTGWRDLEEDAKTSASMNLDWTYVEVALTYDNTYPAGIPRRIDAEWGTWGVGGWGQQGTAGPLIQADPSLTAGGKYLPATQITTQMLKNWGLKKKDQAQWAKFLIDQTWKSQDDFDEAWAGDDTSFPVGDILVEETDAQGHMYVEEEDGVPGPYPVIVKVG